MIGLFLGMSSVSLAGDGHVASIYGLSGADLGTAGSYSLFNDGPSASYYSPSSLALSGGHSLGLHVINGYPSLGLESENDASYLSREGDELATDDNQFLILGIKLGLNDALGLDRRLSLGMVMAVDDLGRSMLNLEDRDTSEGELLRYGQKPLFMSAGVGYEVLPGFTVGFGTLIGVSSQSPVKVMTETDGETSEENILVKGKTKAAEILSVGYTGEAFALGIAYRGESYYDMNLEADAFTRVTPDGPIPMRMKLIDGYTPNHVVVNAKIRPHQAYSFGVAVEVWQWSELTEKLRTKSSAKSDVEVEFIDTMIPRLGLTLHEAIARTDIMLGYAFEPTPLKNEGNSNLIDLDRHMLGLGAKTILQEKNGKPLALTVAYQWQHLPSRKMDMKPRGLGFAEQGDSESVEVSGDVHSVSFGVELAL